MYFFSLGLKKAWKRKIFLDLKKYVATKLKIPNGPKAASIASAVQKDVKMKYPDLKDALKIVEKAKDWLIINPPAAIQVVAITKILK